jgi:hypothetical protein
LAKHHSKMVETGFILQRSKTKEECVMNQIDIFCCSI